VPGAISLIDSIGLRSVDGEWYSCCSDGRPPLPLPLLASIDASAAAAAAAASVT